jgi:hypothetical protein
MGLISGDQRIM